MKVRFAVSLGPFPPAPAELAEAAAEAEQLGFDGMWFSDLPTSPATSPLGAVEYCAPVSQRIRLGVNLIPFGWTPFVLARQVAEADCLSSGRLLITLVPGLGSPLERRALGTEGRDRAKLLERLLPLLRAWWAGEEADGIRLPATPRQQPLEVWLGGRTEAAARRAGRLADGWLGSGLTAAGAAGMRKAIEAEATAAGRSIDPEHFGLSLACARDESDLSSPALRSLQEVGNLRELVPVGTAELRAMVAQLVDAGLSKFVVRPAAPPAFAQAGTGGASKPAPQRHPQAQPGPAWREELARLAEAVVDLQT